MKIATWNVNSLKVRLPHVLDWLASAQPDVLALQETKTVDENFPRDEVEAAGYHAVFAGQKTYNGVALLTREPAELVEFDVSGLGDEERRLIAGTVGGVRVVDVYVVNGKEVASDKYEYKLRWLERLKNYLETELRSNPELVVLGDFNIAPADEDVHDPAEWHEKILCSTPERDALKALLSLGLHDTFRLFEQPPASFSWWDYRAAGFRRNRGLRIDLILASDALKSRCTASSIDVAPRKLERPSDHTPVLAEFS